VTTWLNTSFDTRFQVGMTAVPLVGRDRERDTISRLLEGVHDRGGALVVAGEAGAGKSALLAAAAGMAADRGMLVLSTAGVQSETNLPFAALHQLLRPVLAQVSNLPAMQREAMQAAFAMTDAAVPDLFLIALATLELLSEVAGGSPVVLIADDAQWLDRSSADVLTFVARRVEWDPIAVLASVRAGHDSPLVAASLPGLRLRGLADRPAQDLLDAHFPGLAPAVRERLLKEAEGNPLALLELPTALSSGARGGEAVLPRHLPLSVRLERAFAARTAALPATTRVLLQVAAAGDGSVLAEIMEAARIVAGVRPVAEDLDPAVGAGLIQVGGPVVRFRHPLVRSAVYQAATVAERHAAHAALAGVLAGDPDRRAWHRAAAVVGKDPTVATELEEAAGRARRRGDLITAVAGYERAAALTEDPRRRGELLLRAAEVASELGRSEMVRRLLREADALELGPRERAWSMWLADAFPGGSARDPAPVHALAETARAMIADGDSDLALSLLSAAARRCYWGDLSGQPVADVLDAADRAGIVPDDPRLLYIQAYAAPLERGATVLGQLARLDLPGEPGALQLLAFAATLTGAFDRALPLSGAAAARLREQGCLGVLAQVLPIQSWAAIMVGANYPAAVTAAEEGARLAAETTQPLREMQAWLAQATIAALRGDHAAAEDLAARIERTALPLGAASNLALVQYARGLSALGRGRHEEAYGQLRRVYEPGDPAHHHLFVSFDIGDLAEAAAHSGHRDEAHTIMGHVESLARQTPSPWVYAALRYARAVLAGDEEAEAAFRDAAGDEGMARWPFLRARLQLAFGEWLRRQRRTTESRAPLRAARDAFDALGVTPWGERARQELRAAGETSRRRARVALDVLTPQELQIVQMAAEGLSNREIGQKLYLSHRTVESHLYRTFPKLGITSRTQLLDVLGSPMEPPGRGSRLWRSD
jgi:DNA-binding CsgD family transcriptional regulator/tetratricopeptide (TPR) repeat protein